MKTLSGTAVLLCAVAIVCGAQAQQSPRASKGEYQIGGTMIGSLSGQPLAGVSVLIAPVENREALQTTRTGSDGRFSFAGLTRGKYALGAGRRGYPPQGFNQHEEYSTAIAVGPELDTEHIVFRLHPEASIRGRVFDEENEPVQNASVSLFATRTDAGRLSTRMVRGRHDGRSGILLVRASA